MKHLKVFYGKAGSGKSTKFNEFKKEHPEYYSFPHDTFYLEEDLYPTVEQFQRNLLDYAYGVPFSNNVIIERLIADYDLALVYVRFFISLYTSKVIRNLKIYDNLLLEIPYYDASTMSLIKKIATKNAFDVDFEYVSVDETIRIDRLQKRGWKNERIFLTKYLWSALSSPDTKF